MADDDTTPTPNDAPAPTTEQPPPTGTPAGERVFTQADVDRIVKERIARERQKPAENARTNAPQPQPQKNDPPPSNGSDALAILKLRDDFDDAISDLTLTGAQKKFVRGLVMKERPDDVAGYVSNFVALSGWSTTPTPATAPGAPPPQPANPAVPSPIPVTSRGVPPAPSAPTEGTPIMSMSEADKRALTARIGEKAFAEQLLKELTRDKTKVRPRLV